MCREKFEEWFGSPRPLERNADGSYKYLAAESAWDAWNAATIVEREACADLCSEVGQQPSSLWHEHGCWRHAAQVCAESIALRSNAIVSGLPHKGD